jgi:hypothetical protein
MTSTTRVPPPRVTTPRTRRDRRRTLGFGAVAIASLAALLLLPGVARAQPDPTVGRDLYLDTPNTSGVSTLSASCTNCHGTVQQLRTQRFGSSAWGDVSFDQAMTRIASAMNRIAPMQPFRALSTEQFEHIGAYIADVPRTDVAALDFVAGAAGATVDQTVTLRHATTAGAGDTLRVQSIALGAHSPARFTLNGGSCVAGTTALNASGTCTVSVRYTGDPAHSATAPLNVPLTLRLQVGSATVNRAVTLTGSVTGATPPPGGGGGGTASGSDSGGGALGAGWLVALAAAAAALRRRRTAD